MSPAELAAHPSYVALSHAATLVLLHFLWQGLTVAALLALTVELLGLRRPQARYACSLAALLVMIACPLLTLAWLGQAEGTGVGGQGTGNRGQATVVAAVSAVPGLSSTSPLTDMIAAAQPYVLSAWIIGVAFFACRLLAGMVGVRQLRRGRLPLPRDLADRAAQLGRCLGMRAQSIVYLSRHVGEAMAVGLVKSIVLIPAAWATEMPLIMLEAVMAHELAHLQRRDLWVNLIQRVVETLLFYHPAVWWLSRRLRAERELCCDELAVAVTGRKLEYVQALETVARRGALVEPLLAAGIRGESNMQLLERVRNVLGLSVAADRARLWPAGLVALLLPLAAWGWSAGLIAPQTSAAVADDDRDDDDDDRDDREDDDDDDEKEGREDRDDDDGDDEEKEGREKEGRQRDDDDSEEREVRKEDKDDEDEKEIRIEIRKEIRGEGDDPREKRQSDEAKFFNKFDKDPEIRVERVKKPAPKDGEIIKKPSNKYGEGGKIIRKDGERFEIELKGEGDGDRRVAELMIAVKKLTAENERLQAELFKLRGGKKEPAVYEKEEAIREKETYKRAVADKEEAIARERKIKELNRADKEAAERKELEIRERKIKDAGDKEAILREIVEKTRQQAREAEERAREAVQKAEEQARRAQEEARRALEESLKKRDQ